MPKDILDSGNEKQYNLVRQRKLQMRHRKFARPGGNLAHPFRDIFPYTCQRSRGGGGNFPYSEFDENESREWWKLSTKLGFTMDWHQLYEY